MSLRADKANSQNAPAAVTESTNDPTATEQVGAATPSATSTAGAAAGTGTGTGARATEANSAATTAPATDTPVEPATETTATATVTAPTPDEQRAASARSWLLRNNAGVGTLGMTLLPGPGTTLATTTAMATTMTTSEPRTNAVSAELTAPPAATLSENVVGRYYSPMGQIRVRANDPNPALRALPGLVLGITARGLEVMPDVFKEKNWNDLRDYPDISGTRLAWATWGPGSPQANIWEQNSGGKPWVPVNVWGHGSLGILELSSYDKMYADLPLSLRIPATIATFGAAYHVFETFGEGSQNIRYEPNDFFITFAIPSTAYALSAGVDALVGRSVLSPWRTTLTAAAQAGAEIGMQHDKLSNKECAMMGGYVLGAGAFDLASQLGLKLKDPLYGLMGSHLESYAGLSSDIGPYLGTRVDVDLPKSVTTGVGVANSHEGQRLDLHVETPNTYLGAYVEHRYPRDNVRLGQLSGGIKLSVGF